MFLPFVFVKNMFEYNTYYRRKEAIISFISHITSSGITINKTEKLTALMSSALEYNNKDHVHSSSRLAILGIFFLLPPPTPPIIEFSLYLM